MHQRYAWGVMAEDLGERIFCSTHRRFYHEVFATRHLAFSGDCDDLVYDGGDVAGWA